MMKLEAEEVEILYNMCVNAQIQGKDAVRFGKIMEKLQKEMEKFGATFG
jgi:hypothetical protein